MKSFLLAFFVGCMLVSPSILKASSSACQPAYDAIQAAVEEALLCNTDRVEECRDECMLFYVDHINLEKCRFEYCVYNNPVHPIDDNRKKPDCDLKSLQKAADATWYLYLKCYEENDERPTKKGLKLENLFK